MSLPGVRVMEGDVKRKDQQVALASILAIAQPMSLVTFDQGAREAFEQIAAECIAALGRKDKPTRNG